MICDIYGKEGARFRKITEADGKGADLFLIENIPIISCSHFGESYYTAETLHEIDWIKLHRKSFAKPRYVELTTFFNNYSL